jgi:hypothetical protein
VRKAGVYVDTGHCKRYYLYAIKRSDIVGYNAKRKKRSGETLASYIPL